MHGQAGSGGSRVNRTSGTARDGARDPFSQLKKLFRLLHAYFPRLLVTKCSMDDEPAGSRQA